MIRTAHSLRFIFIYLVVINHAIGDALFSFGGECGVTFFFVLSGFFVSYSTERKPQSPGTLKLCLGLLRKVYPLHLLLAAAFFFIALQQHQPLDLVKIATNLLLLQGWTMDAGMCYSLNTVSWFLSDLLFCYAMFRVLHSVIMRLSAKMLTAVIVFILTLYMLFASHVSDEMTNSLLYLPCPLRLIDFSLGIITYRTYRTQRFHIISARFTNATPLSQTIVETLPVACMVTTYLLYWSVPVWFRVCALFWPGMVLVVLAAVMADGGRGVITRLLQSRPMQWLGSISMELYLTHPLSFILFVAIAKRMGLDVGWQEAGTIGAPFVILIAWMTSLLNKKIQKLI